MRVGKLRTTPEQIAQGYDDQNLYNTFIVCEDCGYKLSPAQNRYRKLIVHNEKRNDVISDLAVKFIRSKRSTIVYVGEIEHADLLTTLIHRKLLAAKLPVSLCRICHGGLDTEENAQTKIDFDEKEIYGVVCTSIWGEGVDLTQLQWVIYAKAGLPGIELEQVIGRSLRSAPAKFRAGFIDFDDEFDLKFATRSRRRREFLAKKGFKPKQLVSRGRNFFQEKTL